MPTVALRDIVTSEDRAAVMGLRRAQGQDAYLNSMGSPRGFYLRYGFTDTGRTMWGENVLALDLAG
jgi:hypothetical protein